MSIKKYVIGEVFSSILFGSIFLFFSYRTFLTGKNAFMADLFGLALFAASLLLIISGTRWIGLLSPFKRKVTTKATIEIPCSLSLPINLNGVEDEEVIVFFTNVSPDALSGSIAVVLSGSERPCAEANLASPKPYRALNNKEYWSRGTGKYFPLKLSLGAAKGSSAHLKIDLKWNFEGTYLERLIPDGKKADIEVWV